METWTPRSSSVLNCYCRIWSSVFDRRLDFRRCPHWNTLQKHDTRSHLLHGLSVFLNSISKLIWPTHTIEWLSIQSCDIDTGIRLIRNRSHSRYRVMTFRCFISNSNTPYQSTYKLLRVLCVLSSKQTDEELKRALDWHYDWVPTYHYPYVGTEIWSGNPLPPAFETRLSRLPRPLERRFQG